jgi:hypothetical protein
MNKCEDCGKEAATYEVAGMRLCGECIAPYYENSRAGASRPEGGSMDINEIKLYAEQEIAAFDMMDELEREEYDISPLALSHLRMRHLILVAEQNAWLKRIAFALEALASDKQS